MTGIEVVGLILGVIPLLITGLEYSRKGLHPIKAFLHKPEELKNFRRALKDQITLLRLSITELFSDIDGVSPQQLQALQDDDDHLNALLTDRLLIAKVENKLGSSSTYLSYIGNIERIKAALETLVRKNGSLNLLSPKKASRASLDTLLARHQTTAWSPEDILERFKFSSRYGKRKKLLNEIKECNDYLEKLMVRNRKVQSITKRQRERLADPLHRVRQCACMVHEALSQVWRCSCQTPHNAKLRLEKRDPNTVLSAENISFRLLFSRESVQGTGQAALWHWQETEIQIPHKSLQPQLQSLFNPTPPLSSHGPSNPQHATLAEVSDICETFSSAQAHMHCLGFILDENQNLRGTYQALRVWHTSSTSREVVSLGVLLTRKIQSAVSVPTTRDDADRLTRKERLVLAANLASSLLQLHTTPWLNKIWTKQDIMFLKRDTSADSSNQSSPARPVNAAEPFVSRTFLSCHGPPQIQQPQSNIFPRSDHPNYNLLALGIILLELYFDQSIESRRRPEDLVNGFVNGNTDFNVANRWLDECYQHNMSNQYWTATKYCISCFFDPMPQSRDLHDEDFRNSVYRKIVLPLEMELKQWQSTEP